MAGKGRPRRARRPVPRPDTEAAPTRATRRAGPRADAEAALFRLVRANPPGQVSLAGAYALGYAALGLAQQERDKPDWFDDLDPLDTLFLGTAWPLRFHDKVEFGNARTAWYRLLRQTPQWAGVQRFVHAVVAASDEHQLPVDDGELMLLLAGRLEDAGLDRPKRPKALLPGTALADARFVHGPRKDLVLPEPAPDTAVPVERLWAGARGGVPHDGIAADALREGLGMLAAAGLPVREEPALLLPALYVALVASPDRTCATPRTVLRRGRWVCVRAPR